MRRETIAIHHGYSIDPVTKAVAVPIYQTTAYGFDSADHGAALFNLEQPGHMYTRLSNPTTDIFEQRMAALEGGVAALAVASGQTAITYALQCLCVAGDNIVTLPQLYGATGTLFFQFFASMGITVRCAASDDPASVEPLIDARTRAVYAESVGNPAMTVTDIIALAEVAHRHGVPLVIDNTIPTPILLRPIEHGADVVVHSATKFICGHGTTLGGVIVDAGNFDWRAHRDRFPQFTRPEPAYHGVVYTEQYGRAAYLGRCRTVPLRNTGGAMTPFAAWLMLQGLQTLALRMERHVANASAVAEYLRHDPRVAWVTFLGLPDNPYHALAQRYLSSGTVSLLTFGVAGGFTVGKTMFDALKLFIRLVNLGDTKSLVTHPASTTHRNMSPEEQERAGVTPEMIRLSVGIEHIDDIIADLDQALTVASRQHAT